MAALTSPVITAPLTAALGQHTLVEFERCDAVILADCAAVRRILLTAAERAHATVVTDTFHMFSPHGVSGVVVIAESHLTVHTWPEHGYAAVDIFTCGRIIQPQLMVDYIGQQVRAGSTKTLTVARGVV